MGEERIGSPRQVLKPSKDGLCRLGIYVNSRSQNLFYADYVGSETCINRIKPKRVWLDDDGLICCEIERRNQG